MLHEWDETPLGRGCPAVISLETGGTGDTPVLAASSGDRSCTIGRDQVGTFLRAHEGATFVCHDVGSVFWAVVDRLCRASEGAAQGLMWQLARAGRLHDVRLLDQLVRAAEHTSRPRAGSLGDLAGSHLGLALTGEPTLQARADAVLKIYRSLREAADRIVARHGVDAGVVERFGPLALTIQVQGAIALAAAERTILSVDDRARHEVVTACEAVCKAGIEKLWDDGEVRQCFKRGADKPKLTATGFPEFKGRTLEVWLERVAGSMVCLHAIPYTPPTSASGRVSTDPWEWEFWVHCHPLLRAWSDLKAASNLRHRYDQLDNTASRPRYELLPFIRSVGPDLDHLRRLGVRPTFRPGPRQTFLVLALPDLETRALASICSRQSGWGGGKAMAEVFERGDDIRASTAARLLFMGREGFDALERRDPALHSHGLELAGMLLYAAPRGIDPGLLRSVAEDVCGVNPTPCAIPEAAGYSRAHKDMSYLLVSDQTDVTIEEGYRRLVHHIYPELGRYLADDAVAALAENLGIDPGECAREFGLGDEFESTGNALRKLLPGARSVYSTGRHHAWAVQVWRRLHKHDRDGRWGPLIEPGRGSPAAYAGLLGRVVVTPVGRVHGRLDYPTARSRPFTSLAGDAVKAALFAVVAAGHRLVACAGGEFVVEMPASADLEARRLEIERLAGRAAEVVLDGVPVACKGEFRDRW